MKFQLCCMLSIYDIFCNKAESWSCAWVEGRAGALSLLKCAHSPDPLPATDRAGSHSKFLFSVCFSLFCWFLLHFSLFMMKFSNWKRNPTHTPLYFFAPPTDRQLVTSCFSNDEKHVDISSQSLVVAQSDGSQAFVFQWWWIFILSVRSQTNCLPPSDPLRFFPPPFSPCFLLHSSPYSEDLHLSQLMRQGFSSDIVSLWQHHISPSSLLPFFLFSSSHLFDILRHDDNDKQVATFLKYFNHIWAFWWLQSTKFVVSKFMSVLRKCVVCFHFYWLILKLNFLSVF